MSWPLGLGSTCIKICIISFPEVWDSFGMTQWVVPCGMCRRYCLEKTGMQPSWRFLRPLNASMHAPHESGGGESTAQRILHRASQDVASELSPITESLLEHDYIAHGKQTSPTAVIMRGNNGTAAYSLSHENETRFESPSRYIGCHVGA